MDFHFLFLSIVVAPESKQLTSIGNQSFHSENELAGEANLTTFVAVYCFEYFPVKRFKPIDPVY